jgi:DNA replication protein DnaC
MIDTELLKPKLVRLKLSGVLETLDDRLSEAASEHWDYSSFLTRLLTDEIERRDSKIMTMRLARSGLDGQKTLAAFDFSFNPKIPKATLKELSRCRFIEEHRNLFVVGPSGVGKSHIAQAIGLEACLRGYDVLYRNTHDLFRWINSGRLDNTSERRLGAAKSIAVLILDDFGLQALGAQQQEDLYDLVSHRHERMTTIITSNRDFKEWPQVFSNPLMGSAAMDRLVHRALRLTITGPSYRFKTFLDGSPEQTDVSNLTDLIAES